MPWENGRQEGPETAQAPHQRPYGTGQAHEEAEIVGDIIDLAFPDVRITSVDHCPWAVSC
jgi:hypothetical protein